MQQEEQQTRILKEPPLFIRIKEAMESEENLKIFLSRKGRDYPNLENENTL